MLFNGILKLRSLFLLLLVIAITGCGGGGGALTPEEVQEINNGINNGEYVKLNLSNTNTINRGKEVFETVMKKYQPVIDFYGAEDKFRDMVNTSLLLDAESLVSPSDTLFNYDSMSIWGDIEFVVEYEDGTKGLIKSKDIVKITGETNTGTDYIAEGKKVTGYFIKLIDAKEVTKKIIDAPQKINNFLESNFGFGGSLLPAFKNQDTMIKIGSTLASVGKIAGYLGFALNVVQFLFPGSSAEDAVNAKLDYVIDLIKGMYEHLEFIENRLTEVQATIVLKAGKQVQLDLKSITNSMNGSIEELGNVPSLENKKATAMDFRNQINGFIQNYIDFSEADYDNFVEYQSQYAKDPEYAPLRIRINVPHNRNFYLDSTNNINYKVECVIADFSLTNPTALLPLTHEGLEYLKRLYTTRLNINSFIETEENNLNIYNSRTALTYLNNDSRYIGKLRNEIKAAYLALAQELIKTRDNIDGPSTETPTIKDSWNKFKEVSTAKFVYCTHPSQIQKGSGNRGASDRWNYKPWYSLIPEYDYINSSWWYLTTSYPYNSSITFGEETPNEFNKYSDDVTALDDVNMLIEPYLKAKSNKLLEFAASLAALEIQLAMYLNDADYATYAK